MQPYSPLLAIFTGLFELIAAFFAFRAKGREWILAPAGTILLLLSAYQFAEVAVCYNPGTALLRRLAFFDITWLPPVGIWIVYVLSHPKSRLLRAIPLAYFAGAAALCVWIFLDASCLTGSVCELVIARYGHAGPFGIIYGIYFQSGLAVMVFWAAAAMASSEDGLVRRHLANIQTGLLGFLLPSFAVRILARNPEGLLPSVMCHFALVLAVSICALVIRERRAATPMMERIVNP